MSSAPPHKPPSPRYPVRLHSPLVVLTERREAELLFCPIHLLLFLTLHHFPSFLKLLLPRAGDAMLTSWLPRAEDNRPAADDGQNGDEDSQVVEPDQGNGKQ